MKTAFVTGITGQDGSYLAEFLLDKGYKIVGLVSKKYNIGNENIKAIEDKLILEPGDLLESGSLEKIFKKHKPDEVYNLGGLTFIPASWENPALVFDINALGLARILQIIKKSFPKTRLYQASSSKMFGNAAGSPQNEKTDILPSDPYSISKAASHYLVKAFREQFNLFAVSGILFNHESPRRGPEFVTRKITKTAAEIKLGLTKKLKLGDLDALQDWGWAPDYVEAMWLMLQQPKAEDYVIATGKLHSVRDVCQIAFSFLGLNYKDYVKVDKGLLRKMEKKPLVGDSTKARKTFGWKPKINLKQMIEIMVQAEVRKIK